MKIDIIRGQKQSMILEMPWLACYNPEIDWRTEKVKITRYLEKYGKWWRLKQEKLGQKKQKEKEKRKEEEKKEKKKKKNLKRRE